MRAKRPQYHEYQRQCVLNFSGRVDKSSKKNIQIEYKSRVDDKVRIVLQHGALNAKGPKNL